MPNRRDFLKNSLSMGAGSLLLPAFARATSGALAGGATNPSRRVKDIGIQLYTVRTEMLADPVATLKKLAAIGFKELESARSDKGNYYGLAPKEIKKITEDLGMKLRSGHIHVDNEWQKIHRRSRRDGSGILLISAAVLPTPGQDRGELSAFGRCLFEIRGRL